MRDTKEQNHLGSINTVELLGEIGCVNLTMGGADMVRVRTLSMAKDVSLASPIAINLAPSVWPSLQWSNGT